MHICAEIQYDTPDGGVHSDLCLESESDPRDLSEFTNYRAFLHANLDEWLDKSNGTGAFYIGDIRAMLDDEPLHYAETMNYTDADMYGDSPYFDPSVTREALDRDPYKWEL